MRLSSHLQLLFCAVALAHASPLALAARGDQVVTGAEVTNTTCLDPNVCVHLPKPCPLPTLLTYPPPASALDTHSTNVALLAICGGIAGSIQFCGGNPATTVGESGTSKFTLTVADEGATINISKGRWERCVKAARLACPTGTFESTCVGGATTGNVGFSLTEA